VSPENSVMLNRRVADQSIKPLFHRGVNTADDCGEIRHLLCTGDRDRGADEQKRRNVSDRKPALVTHLLILSRGVYASLAMQKDEKHEARF
jgi:hypothetical protein